jgi:hypothetical protein
MPPVLALYEDVLANGAALTLPAAARMIFLVHGGVAIADRALRDGEAWHGEGAATITAGSAGATCWRYELAAPRAPPAAGVISRKKLAVSLDTLPAGELLLRGDSVAFPPGGCAYRHTHQGPGIRCLLEGGIRIDTAGRSTSYGPGGAWYESAPEPLHPRHDPAARTARQKLAATRRPRRRGQAARAAVPNLRRRPDRPPRGVIRGGRYCALSPCGRGQLDLATRDQG